MVAIELLKLQPTLAVPIRRMKGGGISPDASLEVS